MAQTQSLRHVESLDNMKGINRDPACSSVLQDDSSRKVTGNDAECTGLSTVPETVARSQIPATSDEALQLAVEVGGRSGLRQAMLQRSWRS